MRHLSLRRTVFILLGVLILGCGPRGEAPDADLQARSNVSADKLAELDQNIKRMQSMGFLEKIEPPVVNLGDLFYVMPLEDQEETLEWIRVYYAAQGQRVNTLHIKDGPSGEDVGTYGPNGLTMDYDKILSLAEARDTGGSNP